MILLPKSKFQYFRQQNKMAGRALSTHWRFAPSAVRYSLAIRARCSMPLHQLAVAPVSLVNTRERISYMYARVLAACIRRTSFSSPSFKSLLLLMICRRIRKVYVYTRAGLLTYFPKVLVMQWTDFYFSNFESL